MNDTKAIDALIHELELTRAETTALTDAMARDRHVMQDLTVQTKRMADLLETAISRRGFWSRLFR